MVLNPLAASIFALILGVLENRRETYEPKENILENSENRENTIEKNRELEGT